MRTKIWAMPPTKAVDGLKVLVTAASRSPVAGIVALAETTREYRD